MHAYYLSVLIELLAEQGVSEHALLHGSGLEPSPARGELSLSAASLDAIAANALRLSGDAQLGLRLGSHINVASQGIFGYALMTSATVGDALRLLIRYSRAILPGIQIGVRRHTGRVAVEVEAGLLPQALARFYCEVLYAAIVHNGRLLVGEDYGVIPRLDLDYPPPVDASQYLLTFGPDVHFGSERTALSLPEAMLGVAISTANPVAQEIFRRECDRLAALDSRHGSVSERVQQVLLQAGTEFPTGADVARQLHMSESTLQRRLAKEGCRYQQLLDQVRYRLAREYLQGTTLPVAEIASLLGFSDAANFRRTFHRWSHTTPSAVRRAAGAIHV